MMKKMLLSIQKFYLVPLMACWRIFIQVKQNILITAKRF